MNGLTAGIWMVVAALNAIVQFLQGDLSWAAWAILLVAMFIELVDAQELDDPEKETEGGGKND